MIPPRDFKLSLYGVFQLERVGRGTISISSRKARALLAVLALAPRGERTRAWLQDTLWSRSQRPEAQASLRRELHGLRQALEGAIGDLLEIGQEKVRLRLENCAVDALEAAAPVGATLLEGIDLPGAEGFEEWLRTERQAERVSAAPAGGQATPARLGSMSHLIVALYLEADRGAKGAVALIPDMLAQTIAAGLAETGFVRVNIIDPHERPAGAAAPPDIVIRIRATQSDDTSILVVTARRFSDGALLLGRQDAVSVGGGWSAANAQTSALADRCVDQLMREALFRQPLLDENNVTRRAVFTAVEQMFSLNPEDVLKSRATWAGVRAVEENGIFSAWQAYQAVFLADPGHMYDYRLTLEECRENMRRALAEEPFNGLVLSLCAHVEAFLFRDFSAAWDLIDRAGLTGTRHVMYYDALSLLRFYTGRYDQARESANMALSAGRHLSFSYAFATTLCMIEGMAGRYDAAISHGRRALQLEPADRKMSYPPVLRYLGAALAHRGEVDEARTLFGQLPESGRLPSSIGAPGDALPAEAAAEFVRSALVLSRT